MFTIVDLTRQLTHRSLSYPGDRVGVAVTMVDVGDPEVRLTHLTHLDMHLGTHIDAPLHFIPGALDVVALGLALRPGLVVRTRDRTIPASVLTQTSLKGRAVMLDNGWTVGPESIA